MEPGSLVPAPGPIGFWQIEVHTQNGSWILDKTGKSFIYETKPKALDWAVQLRLCHARVRLKHTVISYEDVT
jgi:hypothetical protein